MTYEELQAMAKRELRGPHRGPADEEDAVMALIMAVFEAEGADLARIDRDAALKIMRKERRKQIRLQKRVPRLLPEHLHPIASTLDEEALTHAMGMDYRAGKRQAKRDFERSTGPGSEPMTKAELERHGKEVAYISGYLDQIREEEKEEKEWARRNPTEAECDERVRRALSRRKKKKARPPVWETPSDFPALLNPSGRDVYDPTEEQKRAQVQAIYETEVRRELGLPYDTSFRDGRGNRLDVKHRIVGPNVWGMQGGLRIRHGDKDYLRKAKQRYRDVDHLVRNRQDYEETLALHRQSGFYRPTQEPTKDGLRYFVWPMPPGVELPMWMVDKAAAKEYARELSDRHDPRRTGKWWKPPRQAYTKGELDYWLPPASAFKL